MKTEEEMRAMFPYCPEACDNTLEIADKCYVELDGTHHPAALPVARSRRDAREPVPPRVREGPAPALW